MKKINKGFIFMILKCLLLLLCCTYLRITNDLSYLKYFIILGSGFVLGISQLKIINKLHSKVHNKISIILLILMPYVLTFGVTYLLSKVLNTEFFVVMYMVICLLVCVIIIDTYYFMRDKKIIIIKKEDK